MQANFKILLRQLNNLSNKESNDNENLFNSRYRDISYFSNLDMKINSKCISLFHHNVNSLSNYFDNFNHLISELKLYFDILGISGLPILKSQSLNTNVSLQTYVIKQNPTELTVAGALLYMNKKYY